MNVSLRSFNVCLAILVAVVLVVRWRQSTVDPTGDQLAPVHVDVAAALSLMTLVVKTGVDVVGERLDLAALEPFRHRLLIVADSHLSVGDPDIRVFNGADERYLREAHAVVAAHPDKFAAILTQKDQKRAFGQQTAGWLADQLKFFTGLREAYWRFPDSHWFFVVDDDTWISAAALAELLASIEWAAKELLYIGNPFVFDGCGLAEGQTGVFAHGGSGILVSRALAREFVEVADACIVQWRECTGDVGLSRCFDRLGANMQPLQRLHADTPTEETVLGLCSTPITFHHVDADLRQQLDALDAGRRSFKFVRETMLERLLAATGAAVRVDGDARVLDGFASSGRDLMVLQLRERSWFSRPWLDACLRACRSLHKCAAVTLDAAGSCALKGSVGALTPYANLTAAILFPHSCQR